MKVKKINLPDESIQLLNYYNPSMPFFIGMIGRSDYTDGKTMLPERRVNFQALVVAFLRRGRGIVVIDDKEYKVKEGDLFFMPKGHTHYCKADADTPWISDFIVVDGELAHKMLELYIPKDRWVIENFNAEYFMSGIRELYDTYAENMEEFIKYATLLYCSFIVDVNASLSRGADKVAYRVKYIIDYNSHKNLTVKDIADKLHYSVNYVIRSFKKEFDKTPAQYYLERKIELAQMYLRTSEDTVSEISEKLNFIDQHYFSNAFKRSTGMTPSLYREKFKPKTT